MLRMLFGSTSKTCLHDSHACGCEDAAPTAPASPAAAKIEAENGCEYVIDGALLRSLSAESSLPAPRASSQESSLPAPRASSQDNLQQDGCLPPGMLLVSLERSTLQKPWGFDINVSESHASHCLITKVLAVAANASLMQAYDRIVQVNGKGGTSIVLMGLIADAELSMELLLERPDVHEIKVEKGEKKLGVTFEYNRKTCGLHTREIIDGAILAMPGPPLQPRDIVVEVDGEALRPHELLSKMDSSSSFTMKICRYRALRSSY
eukprot:TRINITY_DN18456_c0_g1_i1.p1 TRINITY_DN18456_c0_g1~~TRINITY_DN18456_c0_g1_i1.p1  ORF type:complete len:264 (+),score=55.71 TRINITY_DN18456_c0_g1_i1:69-860(+)